MCSSDLAGQLATYAAEGLLGPDLQVIHLNNASAEEIALAAEHQAPASVSPFTELQIGYGQPVTSALLAAGVPTGTKTTRAAAHAASKTERGRTTSAATVPALRRASMCFVEGGAGFVSFLSRSCSRRLLSISQNELGAGALRAAGD